MKKISAKIIIRIIAFALAACFIFAFAACTKDPKPDDDNKNTEAPAPKEDVDVNAVAEKLIETGVFTDLINVPENDLEEVYGLDVSKIKQYVYRCTLNPYSDLSEIAIFEAADADYVDALRKFLENHINTNKTTAQGYSDPAQYQMIEPTEVKVVGNFVYAVVGQNYNDLMKILKDNIG